MLTALTTGCSRGPALRHRLDSSSSSYQSHRYAFNQHMSSIGRAGLLQALRVGAAPTLCGMTPQDGASNARGLARLGVISRQLVACGASSGSSVNTGQSILCAPVFQKQPQRGNSDQLTDKSGCADYLIHRYRDAHSIPPSCILLQVCLQPRPQLVHHIMEAAIASRQMRSGTLLMPLRSPRSRLLPIARRWVPCPSTRQAQAGYISMPCAPCTPLHAVNCMAPCTPCIIMAHATNAELQDHHHHHSAYGSRNHPGKAIRYLHGGGVCGWVWLQLLQLSRPASLPPIQELSRPELKLAGAGRSARRTATSTQPYPSTRPAWGMSMHACVHTTPPPQSAPSHLQACASTRSYLHAARWAITPVSFLARLHRPMHTHAIILSR